MVKGTTPNHQLCGSAAPQRRTIAAKAFHHLIKVATSGKPSVCIRVHLWFNRTEACGKPVAAKAFHHLIV
jgi:hypothetical protein